METTFRIPNREIAMAAFESLRHEGKKDTALRKYGGEPVTGYGYTAYFHFSGETEMEKEKYEKFMKENG